MSIYFIYTPSLFIKVEVPYTSPRDSFDNVIDFNSFKYQNFKREDIDKVYIGNLKTIKTYYTVKTLSFML